MLPSKMLKPTIWQNVKKPMKDDTVGQPMPSSLCAPGQAVENHVYHNLACEATWWFIRKHRRDDTKQHHYHIDRLPRYCIWLNCIAGYKSYCLMPRKMWLLNQSNPKETDQAFLSTNVLLAMVGINYSDFS